MTAAIIIPLARGCSSPPVGLSARGADYLPGAPRCALASASLCQEAADQFSHDIADRLPGLGVVPEVVVTGGMKRARDLFFLEIHLGFVTVAVARTLVSDRLRSFINMLRMGK